MNNSGESLVEEATARKMEVLNTKTKTRIGFWNVRTMYQTGKMAQVTAEMRRYNLHILGISESRWTGSGRVVTSTTETVLYSGREDNNHEEGVAIILRKGVEKNLIEWKPLNSRLMRGRIKGKHVNLTIIQCYSPTNDSDDEVKDLFYEQLEAEIKATPRHDMMIIMGDLNAKVGNDNSNCERAIGKHGCGTMNENGERLIELCVTNNLVVGSTLFPHRDIHKLTWYSPNNRDKNQIDHLLINGMWRRSLLDVRVKRGADVGSDHQLVTAMVRLKLRKAQNKTHVQRKFDTQKLNDPRLKHRFVTQVRNRIQALQDLNTEINPANINEAFNNIKTAYQQSAEEYLGYREKKRSKEWIKPNTWKVIDERRKLKNQTLSSQSERLQEKYKQKYKETNKTVKRMVRADRRAFVEELARGAEIAAARGEQSMLHRISKQICGKYHSTVSPPIRNKEGKLLTTEAEQDARWAEHFKEVLNRKSPEENADIPEGEIDLDISIELPTKEEIVAAIKKLKNNKAPGLDNLNAELFKTDPETAAEILEPLFRTIWRKACVPEEWTKGVIIKIPKKGNLSDCNNWRGITLLSIPSKILAKVIISRLSSAVDSTLRKEQAGFRKGRSCTEQIFALRNIIEQSAELQRQLYVNFIDFEKAFDSVHRDSLWHILRAYGIPKHLVKLIKSFYKNYSCCVGGSDIWFEVTTGVRQGCVMSALLFNLVIDWVMRRSTETGHTGIRWTLFSTLEDLDFADDLALISHTHQHMQDKTNKLNQYSSQVGLKINQKKSEVMTINTTTQAPIKINNDEITFTESFVYLGSIITPDGGSKKDIQNRLNKARSAFISMSNIWRSSQYSVKTKLKLYNSCIIPVLLYGAECWRMTQQDLTKLSTFHTKSLRKILKIFWPNKISNEDLLSRCNQENMPTIIMKRRWQWIGHVLRKEDGSIIKTALHWTPDGRRKRGRPKVTWRRMVEQELKDHHHTWGTIGTLAQDRQKWKDFVAALCAFGVKGSK
ncbi:uncharacterized protein [Paramisgurnus dabryanus]|uniref:uncharacterized protein n=1 Tax=Paramisgurnus dabryanus TaxID=90735 RepID=UPI003CCF30AB